MESDVFFFPEYDLYIETKIDKKSVSQNRGRSKKLCFKMRYQKYTKH